MGDIPFLRLTAEYEEKNMKNAFCKVTYFNASLTLPG